MPYKTTLLNGRWDVGQIGIRLYGPLCLLATLGFIAAAASLAAQTAWWPALMTTMAIYSLVLTILDFKVAYGGPIVNVLILILVWLAPRLDL